MEYVDGFDYNEYPEDFEDYEKKVSESYSKTDYGHSFIMSDESEKSNYPVPYYGISTTSNCSKKKTIKLGELFKDAEKVYNLKRTDGWQIDDEKINVVKSLLIFYADYKYSNSSYSKVIQNLREFLPENWKLVVVPTSGECRFESIKLD